MTSSSHKLLPPRVRFRSVNWLTCAAMLASQLLLLPNAGYADVLYGAQGASATTSSLYILDPLNGATISTVGAIGYAVTGMAFDPTTSTLYGVTTSNSGASPLSLISINISTGAGTVIGSLGGNQIADIAINSTGQLYGWSESGDKFATIDKTTGAVVTSYHQTSFGDAMSFNSAGVLYYAGDGSAGVLQTIDPATGHTTDVATMNGSGNSLAAGAFNAADQLYAVDNNSGTTHLVQINTTTGAITNLGSSLAKLDAIAFFFAFGPPPAELSAQMSGLSFANAEGQALIAGSQTVTNDINGHLFSLRAGNGEEESDGSIASATDDGVIVGQGDGNPDKNPMAQRIKRTRQWEAFATVNYGNAKLSAINNQAGVQVDSWASGAGIERHLSRGLTLGFALSFLQSTQTYTSGLGSVRLEGPAVSTYLAYARKNVWASLLYSFGDYDMGTMRNPGFGFTGATGSTTTYTNSVQFNTGYNFRFQNNTLVTGPFIGADYMHGSVNGYSETGGGGAALTFARQTYQSLVTRVGWSTSKKIDTNWATITPQFRLSYERQNLNNNGTSVSLINAPFTAAGGNQHPGQDYMVIGSGVNFQFTPDFGMLLGYQTQIFRNNLQAHFGSVRLGYKF